jgi:hypothetical protein
VQIAKREEYSIFFDIFVKVWFCYFVKERKKDRKGKGVIE